MTKRKYQYKPRLDQFNSTLLTTDTVQYWRNGVMVTCMMTKESARNLVIEGKAFVITSQAIGAIGEDGYSIA